MTTSPYKGASFCSWPHGITMAFTIRELPTEMSHTNLVAAVALIGCFPSFTRTELTHETDTSNNGGCDLT